MIESLLVPDSDVLMTPISVDRAEGVLSIWDLPDHVLESRSEPIGILLEEKYLKEAGESELHMSAVTS